MASKRTSKQTDKKTTAAPVVVKWACPRCGAHPNEHGKGDCEDRFDAHGKSCLGFLCECDEETSEAHGTSFDDECPSARCYHCRWSGRFPPRPLEPWEKKALAAGWSPPQERRKQLGLGGGT